MIKLKEILSETPHRVDLENINLHWADDDALPFTYIKDWDEVAIAKESSTHGSLYTNRYIRSYFETVLHLSSAQDYDRGTFPEDFTEGRLWEKHKIITFWQYPSKEEFNKIIDALKKEGIGISSSWQVEVYTYVESNVIEHINVEKKREEIEEEMLVPKLINVRDYK